MNTKRVKHPLSILVRLLPALTLVLSNFMSVSLNVVHAQGDPFFLVRHDQEQVHCNDWTPGETLTLEVDNPDTTLAVPDYTEYGTVGGDSSYNFELAGVYDIQPGYIVTVTNGTVTKVHTVQNLWITNVDIENDKVYGTATPGSEVHFEIPAYDSNFGAYRHEVADPSTGEWVADYSLPGDEPEEAEIYVINPGDSGEAYQYQGDAWTYVSFDIPNPTLHVVPAYPEVHGHEWDWDAYVTLTIDDDTGPANGVLYTASKDVSDDPWCGEPCFDLQGAFNIEPDQIVTMSDNVITKTVTVTALQVTAVDYVADTVSGTTAAGSDVQVDIHEEGGVSRNVTADGAGFWVADFSVVGDEAWEQNTFDIQPGMGGRAIQFANDYSDDGTLAYWQVPNQPMVRVNQSHDWVGGQTPEPDTQVSITVLDEYDVPMGSYTDWSDGSGWFGDWCVLDAGNNCVDIVAGDTVEVDMQGTPLIIVPVIPMTGAVVASAETVSGQILGVSYPADVRGEVWEEGGPSLDEQTDGSGNYAIDFAPYDVSPGVDIAVWYIRPDGHEVGSVFRSAAPHLRINKWTDGNPGEGGNLNFHVQYWNDGDAPAEDVTITDTMLGGLAYLSDTSGFPHTGSGSGPIVWDLGTVPAYSEGQFEVFVQVLEAPPEPVSNRVQIATSNPDDQGDPDEKESEWSGNVEANDTHLNVGKWAWTGDPAPDTDFVYNINICNNGSTGSSEVTLTDTLHPATTLLSWWSQHPGWTEVESNGNHLVVIRPSIPGWGCSEVYLRVHVDASVPSGTYISNTAIIAANNDLEEDDNEAFWDGYVGEPHTNLYLSKDWLGGQLVPGGDLRYELRYGNDGNLPVDSVQIIDTLPENTSLQEIWRFDRNWNRIGQVAPTLETPEYVEWEVGAVENGDWGYFLVVLRVDETAAPGDVLINTLEISPQPDEDDYEDNSITWTNEVHPDGPNLQVHKQNYGWNGDSQLWYEIRVKNFGTERLESITVTDTYPELTTWNGDWHVGHGPWSEPTHDAGTRQLVFGIDSLNPGDTASVDYRVDLDESVHGVGGLYFTNIVEAPWPNDVYPDDNSDTVVAYSGDVKWFVRVNLSHNWVGGETEPGSTIVATVWRDGLPIMADKTETGDGTGWQIDFCCDDERRLQIGDMVEVESSLGLFANVEIIPIDGMVDANSDSASGDISGVDTPADVLVEVWREDGRSQEGQTDGSGHFDFEFTDYDILPGNMVFIAYLRPDGHQVGVIRHALRLDVDTAADTVEGQTASDTLVSVTINGETGTATSDAEGRFSRIAFEGDIKAGDTVEAWAGTQYASLVIENVTANIDEIEDKVWGNGPPNPGSWNNMNVGVNDDWRPTRTDSSGFYEVFYDYDIAPGDRLKVEYQYPEGHQARYGFGPSDVRVDKWAPVRNVSPGDEFTYVIRFSNDWSGTATNIVITDAMPDYVTYLGDDSGVSPTYDPVGNTLTWDLGTLGGEREKEIELHLRLDDDEELLGDRLTNYVEISADNDRDLGNNTSQADADIQPPGADFWVDKELASGQAIPGELITYRVRFGNRGNRPGEGAFLTDLLPANTTFESSTYDTCQEIFSENVAGGQVDWILNPLPPSGDEGCEFEFSVRIDGAAAPGSWLTNEISISEDTGEWADNRDNRRLHNTVVQEPAADLWVDKVIEGDLSDMESEILYRITFRNGGNIPAESVSLADTLPAEMSRVWHSAGSHAIADEGSVTWNLGSVPPGSGGQILLAARLDEGIPADTVMTNIIAGTTSTPEMDTSNNSATVDLGPPLAIAVPWVGTDPHRVWSGLETTLKGVAKGYGLTHYEWDFGDGSPVVSGWIDDPYAVEARHTYVGSVGDTFVATFTVFGAYGWSHSDNYYVTILNQVHGVEKDVAIDEALWYQHKAAERYRNGGLPFAEWGDWNNRAAQNATAIQAFQIHGHLPGGDPLEDPYVEDVQSGWNALLTYAVLDPMSPQPAGDPDSNDNGVGIGMYENYGHSIYESGLVMMALASTGTSDEVARIGPVPYVRGRTYYDIVQDMADWFAWGQNDADPDGPTDWARGGWRYQPNSGDSDNSNTQFPVLGLAAAENNWGVVVPEWVKTELRDYWLVRTQNANGAFGYSGAWGTLNVGKTGAGIMNLIWTGVTVEDDRIVRAAQYIEEHWNDPMDDDNMGSNVGDFYAMYAVKKGSQLANMINYGPYYWDLDYTTYLIDMQGDDGRFDEDRSLGQWFGDWQPLSTSWALLILSEGLYEALPVAIISPYQYGTTDSHWYEGEVQFDGTLSHHTDPERVLDTFEWDFGDGGTGVSMTPYHTYVDNGEYPVLLTVMDDQDKADTDTLLLTVENLPPVIEQITAHTGPVAIDDQPVFVGAVFTDPGIADTHTAYWDWGDSSGEEGFVDQIACTVSGSHTYVEPGVYTILLTVTDDDGGVDTAMYEYIIIYDPDGGFVTGGGWIESPAGAYPADPTLTGKANFGFVSKYKKGAKVPTGNTEFQFHAADLNFHSSSYDWLVVTGSNFARFKGIGTINGVNAPNEMPYKFMLWAGDGTGTDGNDTFRIKIWWEDVENVEYVVYDNGMDQIIGGGNIVVHTKK